MMMELVSVVIPLYNREKTIKMAVDSVLNQTYSNLEVIIVDDCSTDRSVEIVRNIKDDRVRVVLCEKNGGACRARNLGMEHARGTIIAFQDSDDFWHKDKLEKSLHYMKKEKADFVFSALYRTERKQGKKTTQILPSYNLNEEKNGLEKLLCMNCVSTQTIVMKKRVTEKVCFDETFPRFQDWDFALQVLKQGFSVFYIKEPLVNCYVQDDSITSNHEKGKRALKLFEEKYRTDFQQYRKAGYEFYFRAAVMMEKMGYNGAKFFVRSFKANKKAGLFFRAFLSTIRIYAPLNALVEKTRK